MIKSSEISVVVQGPIYKEATQKCLNSIREILPEAEIILSTWEDSDTQGLDYDIVIFNKDPGSTPLFRNNPKNVQNNMNRQILSAKEGIKKAKRKYCLKYRSDLELKNDKFLNFFGKYKERNSNWKILKERVITNYATHPYYRAFHPTDLTCFGLTEDVIKIWDIPLSDDYNSNYFLNNSYPEIVQSPFHPIVPKIGAEMYIWTSFLKKYTNEFEDFDFRHNWDGRKENVLLTELTIANNLLVLDRKDFDFNPLVHKYLFCSTGKHTWMDHKLWEYYYKKHCLRIKWYDFSYHIYYPVALYLYRIKYCPQVQKFFKALLRFGFLRPLKMIALYQNID